MRSFYAVAALAAALGGAPACVHQPPPLPVEPPDIRGTVWAIQGAFSGGGTVVVRPPGVPGQPPPPADRIEIRPGARILLRDRGKLRSANFSRIQLGQHVSAWWDGEPTVTEPARAGPVRVLLIESDAGAGA